MSMMSSKSRLLQGSQPAPEYFYDKIFIGTGLSSLFTAYTTLKTAEEAGRDVDVLIIGNEINAPCAAGSHYVYELEGLMEDDVPNRDIIADLLRHDGADRLVKAIEDEGIDCRLSEGYEIKCKSEDEMTAFMKDSAHKNIYRANEMVVNSDSQSFHLPGYDHSIRVNGMGQVNTPEFLDGMVKAIERLGGKIITGVNYQSHQVSGDGHTVIKTDNGEFESDTVPYMGTGAIHQSKMDEFNFASTISYTGALVIGPLAPADFTKITDKPMAFADINIDDDVLWGGIDSKGMLTIGKGDLPSADLRDFGVQKLVDLTNDYFPGLIDKYPVNVAFGPMIITENKMPVVGRLATCDIGAAWAGLGIVAAMASSEAFAQSYIYGDDSKLKIWEAMQPVGFSGAGAPRLIP